MKIYGNIVFLYHFNMNKQPLIIYINWPASTCMHKHNNNTIILYEFIIELTHKYRLFI